MTSHSIRCAIVATSAAMALVSGAAPAAADPFDFIQQTYGVNTGVRLVFGPNGDLSDGLPVTFPVGNYLADKRYTAQVVNPLTGEKNESYAAYELAGQPRGFGSAVASGTTLEVGVDSQIGQYGSGAAVSRMSLTIKNNHDDRSLDLLEFTFEIPEGLVEITDFSRQFLGQSQVGATIDYLLKSPSGPFGGTWDETTGQLFEFNVNLDIERQLTHSANASVREIGSSNPFYVGYEIQAYRDTLRLPEIPPLGELTLYYDMYAIVTPWRNEMLGKAFLGDPMNLTNDGGFSLGLAESPAPQPVPVPEPATLSLLGAGVLALVRKRLPLYSRRAEIPRHADMRGHR